MTDKLNLLEIERAYKQAERIAVDASDRSLGSRQFQYNLQRKATQLRVVGV